jgi:hypothetical protein
MKKKLILIFAIFFVGTFFYVTTQGATNIVSFTDGAKNLQTITANTDAITKNWADTLVIGSLDKNTGGCRIKLGQYSESGPQPSKYFWQGYSWGAATTTVITNAANSCVCPPGTTRVLRRSQSSTIGSLDTTWWKEFKYGGNLPIIIPVYGWTKDCTPYIKYYPDGCLPGDPNCYCATRYDNCVNITTDCRSELFVYTEYLYNCVANSEILKQ